MAPCSPADIDVIMTSSLWHDIEGAEDAVRRAALAAVQSAAASGPVQISIALASDGNIRELNARYRNQDKPTNVLSFVNGMMLSNAPGPVFLGDVMIAYETTRSEAQAEGKSILDHVSHLTVHGVLHLFGFDHGAAEEAERMEAMERETLRRIGVADPYHLLELSS